MKSLRFPIIPLLLAVLTALVFSEVRDHSFVAWDDSILIYENPYLNPTVTQDKLAYVWRHPHENLYMPLTYSAWAALTSVARLPAPAKIEGAGNTTLDARPFHLASLGLHILNTLLVFALLKRLLESNTRNGEDAQANTRLAWASGAGALLFAIHPLQVEAVAWAAEMKGLLCAFFSLLALHEYSCSAATPSKSETLDAANRDELSSVDKTTRAQQLHYAAATLCFVLALLSKPSAAAIPLLAWAIGFWALGQPARRCALWLLPWFAVSLGWVLVSQAAQPVGAALRTPLWTRPLVAGDALTFYFSKLLLPIGLGFDHGRTPGFVSSHNWVYLTACVPLVLALGVFLWRVEGGHFVRAALAIFIAALLPVSGIVPFIYQVYSTVADRYAYMAMLGPALLLAWWMARARGRLAPIACGVVLLLLGFGAALQTMYWSNSFALFKHGIEVNPRSWNAHYNLATSLDKADNPVEAIAHYRESLRINPAQANAHYNLAVDLENVSARQAMEHYRESLRLDSGKAHTHSNIGRMLLSQGHIDQAIPYFRDALRIDPHLAQAHVLWGLALMGKNQRAEARAHFREALRIDPTQKNVRSMLQDSITDPRQNAPQPNVPQPNVPQPNAPHRNPRGQNPPPVTPTR